MAVQVSDAQAGRVWAHAVGRRLAETAAAVAEVDAHTVGPEQGEVTDAVAVEVGGDDGRGRHGREEPPGVGEGATPEPVKDRERVRARVDDRDVGLAVMVESAGRGAGRRLERHQVGRPIIGERIRAGPGLIYGRAQKGAVAVAREDPDVAGVLVGDDQPDRPMGVELDQADFRGTKAYLKDGLFDEPPTAVAEVDHRSPVARITDDKVGVPVAGEVAGNDLGWERAGAERPGSHEMATPINVK